MVYYTICISIIWKIPQWLTTSNRRSSWPQTSSPVSRQSAAAMQGIFDVQDFLLSCQLVRIEKCLNWETMKKLNVVETIENVDCVPSQPFQDVVGYLNNDQRYKSFLSKNAQSRQAADKKKNCLVRSTNLGSKCSLIGNYIWKRFWFRTHAPKNFTDNEIHHKWA